MNDQGTEGMGYRQALRYAEELRDLYEGLQRANAEQSALLDRIELVINSAGEGICGLDTDGRFTFVNTAAAAILGWPAEDLVNKDGHELMHHTRKDGSPYPREECPIYGAFKDGTVHQVGDEVFWRRDGTSFQVEYTSTPIVEGGRIAGAVVVFSDITERREAEVRLEQTVEALRRTDEERRRLLAHLVNAQEEERRRIAADLHDDSIQAMSAVLMRLHPLRAGATLEQAERIEVVERAVADTIGRLRNLMFELRPAALDREGLTTALRLHFERYQTDAPIELDVEDRLRTEPPAETRALLYRMALEALANVRKHSKARHVKVRVEEQDGGFFLSVRDDGVGLPPPDAEGSSHGHLGMVSMRERAEVAGGRFRIEGARGQGTTVEFWVPAVGVSESA